MITRQNVTEQVLALLRQLASDWDYDGEIEEETWMFSELGFQSLDAVVLGNSLQEEYGRPIPYAELLAEVGQRPSNDVTVGEWVEFTHRHLADEPSGVSHE